MVRCGRDRAFGNLMPVYVPAQAGGGVYEAPDGSRHNVGDPNPRYTKRTHRCLNCERCRFDVTRFCGQEHHPHCRHCRHCLGRHGDWAREGYKPPS